MDLPAFGAAILIVAAVVFVLLATSGYDPAQAMSGMFGYREIGWPRGVQEDDDAHWSWARRSPAAGGREDAEPDSDSDEIDGVPPVQAQRLRYAVRSADRARS
jgi:hypothetical protein